jgi:hypothetical protein
MTTGFASGEGATDKGWVALIYVLIINSEPCFITYPHLLLFLFLRVEIKYPACTLWPVFGAQIGIVLQLGKYPDPNVIR